MKTLIGILLRESTLVLGGNDNGGEHPMEPPYDDATPEEVEAHRNKSFFTEYHAEFKRVCEALQNIDESRYVPNYGGHVFFNKETGKKISVDTDTERKSEYPQLVDMKITDFCPFACPFCYQGSTQKGVHGDTKTIKNYITALAGANVLEIAFGGGEPTLHPDFAEIIAHTRDMGIIPNFTTRNLKWLMDPANAWVIAKCGGVAYSLDMDDASVDKFISTVVGYVGTLPEYDSKLSGDAYKEFQRLGRGYHARLAIFRTKLVIHVVMGVVDVDVTFKNIERILHAESLPGGYLGVSRFTLLGYKDTGFGPMYPKYPYDGWVARAKAVKGPQWESHQIGIDTALVNQTPAEELGSFDPRTYYSKEGQHSFYIDAVKGTAHPSSYHAGEGVSFDVPYRYKGDFVLKVWDSIEML